MAAVGIFVPEIVPGSDGTLETLVPQGHTPMKASLAETVAKVGSRVRIPGHVPCAMSAPRPQVRTSQRSAHCKYPAQFPEAGHKSRWDRRVQIGMGSHVVGLESPFVPTAFVPQA
jgi:hypothetical protein